MCRQQYNEQQVVFTSLGLTMQSLPDAKTVVSFIVVMWKSESRNRLVLVFDLHL